MMGRKVAKTHTYMGEDVIFVSTFFGICFGDSLALGQISLNFYFVVFLLGMGI